MTRALRWLAVPVVATALTTALAAADPAFASAGPAPGIPGPATPPASAWSLPNTEYKPGDFTQEPFVGNGYLGQRVPAIGEGFEGALGGTGFPLNTSRMTTSLVAGVYDKEGNSDYIASLPTWSTLDLTVDGETLDSSVPARQITDYTQTLDLQHAMVTTSMTWTPSSGRSVDVTFQVLANRATMNLGQVQVTVEPAFDGQVSLTSLLDGRSATRITPTARSVDTGSDTSTVRLSTPGRNTAVAETALLAAGPGVTVSSRSAVTPTAPASTVGEQWTVPVRSGKSYKITKYVGISTSNDPGTPATVAASTVSTAAGTGWADLVSAHKAAWAQLWAPNVTVTGEKDLQADVNSQFYLLYSSLRAGLAWSIPPAGLSSDNYGGEIFWDAETWMYPTILAFHPELAKSIVDFRYTTKSAAEGNARGAGFAGGSWAWDNGPSGTCGGLAGCSHYEDHLQSDIALAQWQYYEATGDLAWLTSHGYPVIKDVADFWASRVTMGADGKYHVNGVTGPDEFTSGVNDESATNAGAVVALKDAVLAAQAVGASPDPRWTTVANGMNIAVDADGTHPEYPGYTSQSVKQADTVLMTYPFQYVTDPAVAAADLDRYMAVTDTGGPAMTASVEAVVAAQVQQPGCLDYSLFQDSYQPFLRGPYRQFLETQYLTPSGGQGYPAFDFATGAGGFLQTFAYGFAGLRWDTAGLDLDPTLPPQLGHGLEINGLLYQGRSVNISIGAQTTTVVLNSGAPVPVSSPAGTRTLAVGSPVTLATARPDTAPTDNLARCQDAAATSAVAVDPAAAAVDGNDVTTWTATATTSSYAVTLAKQTKTSRADVVWGATRPATYATWVQLSSGAWTQVDGGDVPAAGPLHSKWVSAATKAVMFTFSGGSAASISELSVPNGAAAHLSTTLSMPQATAPGAPFTVSLSLSSDGGAAADDITNTLSVPSGWTTAPLSSVASLPVGSTGEATWTVTPPPSQTAATVGITARTSWQGANAVDVTSAATSLLVAAVTPMNSTIEAEAGARSGPTNVQADHKGYTGTGFVGNLYAGAADSFAVSAPAAGTYPVTLRYANSTGGQSPPYVSVTRTLSINVGSVTEQVQLPVTADWDTWGTVTTDMPFSAGTDLVRVLVAPDDSGSVNLDSVTVGRN